MEYPTVFVKHLIPAFLFRLQHLSDPAGYCEYIFSHCLDALIPKQRFSMYILSTPCYSRVCLIRTFPSIHDPQLLEIASFRPR